MLSRPFRVPCPIHVNAIFDHPVFAFNHGCLFLSMFFHYVDSLRFRRHVAHRMEKHNTGSFCALGYRPAKKDSDTLSPLIIGRKNKVMRIIIRIIIIQGAFQSLRMKLPVIIVEQYKLRCKTMLEKIERGIEMWYCG